MNTSFLWRVSVSYDITVLQKILQEAFDRNKNVNKHKNLVY